MASSAAAAVAVEHQESNQQISPVSDGARLEHHWSSNLHQCKISETFYGNLSFYHETSLRHLRSCCWTDVDGGVLDLIYRNICEGAEKYLLE